MMLNNKLKEDKRIQKIQKRMNKKKIKSRKNPNKKVNDKKGKSKFQNKYRDRIESIREADEKIKRNKTVKKKNSNMDYKNTKNTNV